MSEKAPTPSNSPERNSDSGLPSRDEVIASFQDRRLELEHDVAGFVSKGEDVPSDLQEAVGNFKLEWDSLGGDLIDKAEADVSRLSFSSTPEERASARLTLSEVQNNFYNNYVASKVIQEEPTDHPDAASIVKDAWPDSPIADLGAWPAEATRGARDDALYNQSDYTRGDVDLSALHLTSEQPTQPYEQAEPAEQGQAKIEKLEYDDKMILGQSRHLRRSIYNSARNFMNDAHETVTQVGNAISTPKNVYLKYRRDRSKSKYERAAAKVGTSIFKFRNKRFQRKAEEARQTYQGREKKFSSHTSMMAGREAITVRRRNERNEAYRKHVEYYMQCKIEAQERKLKRQQRRRMRQEGGTSRFEARRVIRNMSEEDKKRIRQCAQEAIRQRNINKGKLKENYRAITH